MHSNSHADIQRSLKAWMTRTGTTGRLLRALVMAKTGRAISPTLLSFVLRGRRPFSRINALCISDVTGIPVDDLVEPTLTDSANPLGTRAKPCDQNQHETKAIA